MSHRAADYMSHHRRRLQVFGVAGLDVEASTSSFPAVLRDHMSPQTGSEAQSSRDSILEHFFEDSSMFFVSWSERG